LFFYLIDNINQSFCSLTIVARRR